jgi:hypothetical protein
VSSTWDHHWVYWVGPIVGGGLAAIVYNAFFLIYLRPASAAGTKQTTVTAPAAPGD